MFHAMTSRAAPRPCPFERLGTPSSRDRKSWSGISFLGGDVDLPRGSVACGRVGGEVNLSKRRFIPPSRRRPLNQSPYNEASIMACQMGP